jgi:hypothetical protein
MRRRTRHKESLEGREESNPSRGDFEMNDGAVARLIVGKPGKRVEK